MREQSPWPRSREDEETENPASQLPLGSTRRHPETAPPRRSLGALRPEPAASRPRRPGSRRTERRTAAPRCAPATRGTRAATAPGSDSERGKEEKPITKPGFSFPPETAGRQEVTKERSSGPLGLGLRSPPDSRNSPSGADRRGAAASAPQQPLSARPLARPPARGRVTAPPPGPAPPRPGPAASCGSYPGPGCLLQAERAGRLPRAKGPGVREAAETPAGTCHRPSREDCPVCHLEQIAQARGRGWRRPDPMAGSYGMMADDGSIDYTVHEAWNEATNVYLIVILVSFGLFMYAKRNKRKIMRIFSVPPAGEMLSEPSFYDTMNRIRLRQQVEAHPVSRKYEYQQPQSQADSVQLSLE